MWRPSIGLLGLIGMVAVGSTPLFAQVEPSPTPEEMTLRPGDTIRWITSGGHQVQFGKGPNDGKPVTPFATVQSILTLPPGLTPDANGVAKSATNAVVNATVKTTAPVGAKFNFTCGIHHDAMNSMEFTIAAAVPGQTPRNVQIVAVTGPLRWVLKADKRISQ